MKIFIEPNDVLMFRDGKPFSGGDDHYARGIFPPSPATFYGAIRSKILSEQYPQYESFKADNVPEDVKNEIGTQSTYGSLIISNFFLAQRENGLGYPLFPVPKDLARLKEEKEKLVILIPHNQAGDKLKFNFPLPFLTPLWLKDERPLEETSGFLSIDQMKKYLVGEVPNEVITRDSLYQREERVGIKKDRSRRSAATGALYSVEYFRLKQGVGFALDLSGVISLPKEGLLRLGGDHRSAYYQEMTFAMPDIEMVKERVQKSKRFKVIFLTPALFNNGWLPDWIDKESGTGNIDGIVLRLISAAIGKPVPIGGFDFVKKMPKEMKKAVPAGSVYYFELNQGSIDEVFNIFWLKSISSEKQKEGFGITILGGY